MAKFCFQAGKMKRKLQIQTGSVLTLKKEGGGADKNWTDPLELSPKLTLSPLPSSF